MIKAIDEIVRFQTDRGLHLKEFNTLNENTNIVEELLEAHGLDVKKEYRHLLRNEWNLLVHQVKTLGIATGVDDFNKDMTVDAYCDIVVFAIGAIMKLGYDPEKALIEAAKEINSREGEMIDGKFEKDLSDEAKAKWYKANYQREEVK